MAYGISAFVLVIIGHHNNKNTEYEEIGIWKFGYKNILNRKLLAQRGRRKISRIAEKLEGNWETWESQSWPDGGCKAKDINVGKRTEGRKPTRCHLNIQRKWISILICGSGVVSQLWTHFLNLSIVVRQVGHRLVWLATGEGGSVGRSRSYPINETNMIPTLTGRGQSTTRPWWPDHQHRICFLRRLPRISPVHPFRFLHTCLACLPFPVLNQFDRTRSVT